MKSGFKKKIEVKVSQMVNAMPMVGWHDPYGKFDHKGKQWEVLIAGGVQAIIVKRPDGTNFSIQITDIVGDLIDEIESQKKVPWGRIKL